jgi:O-antigen/teichoic acid export membrane protein
LNSAPRQLDNLAIGVFFGTGVAGAFTPAKNLYRVFEQAFDAVSTLLYPAAVRMYAQRRMEDMQVLITKAISVTLIPSIVAIVALELGLSNVITVVLGPTYTDAIAHFNVLIIAGVGMPFLLMNSIIAAMGQSMAIVKYSAMGLIAGAIAFFIVVLLDQPLLVGAALVTNTLVMGALSVAHVRREIHFPLRAMARVIDDVRHVLQRTRG